MLSLILLFTFLIHLATGLVNCYEFFHENVEHLASHHHMYIEKGVISMVTIEPIMIKGHFFTAVVVQLPKTTLLTISNDTGYIMCGALDVGLLNSRLVDRKIIAGRAVGVKTIDELLTAPLESVTYEAEQLGITEGMTGVEALLKMI